MTKFICVGKITSVHGIKGQVKIHSYTEDPKTIGTFGALLSKTGEKEFRIKVTSVKGPVVLANVEGVATRNDAETLRGTELYVLRDMLPEIAEDGEYYQEDLIGLRALLENGDAYGKVVAFHNFGAGDIIEIKRAGNGQTEMLAFNDDTVPEISVEDGTLTVHLPEVLMVSQHKADKGHKKHD